MVLVVMLVLGAIGCRADRPGVDAAAARDAAGSDQALDRMVGRAAEQGVTAEAARVLAVAAVRRAPVLAARANTEPHAVRDFVAALTDADPATAGPLAAAVVEGLGLALHQRMTAYAAVIGGQNRAGVTVIDALEAPSADLERLADAVREGADDEEAVWSALIATLAATSTPQGGSLLGAVEDDRLVVLATAGAPVGVPTGPRDLARQIEPTLRKVVASLLYAEPTFRGSLRLPPDPTLEQFAALPVLDVVFGLLTSAEGLTATPALTLARLVLGSPVPS